MGRSMDWTLADNMVDVCSSAPHSQATEEAIRHLYKQERKRPTSVRKQLSRTQALLGRVILGGGYWCRGWKCGALWDCPPTPHSIGYPSTAPHVCCQMNWWDVVQGVLMCVSIWGAMHLHSMDRWPLSGADFQAPWHGALETCGSIATKLSRLDAFESWKVVRWCRTQASGHNL